MEHVNAMGHDINKGIREAAKAAGISKHLTTHTARHTFAYLASKQGIPVTVIQHALNHSSVATTYKYIQSLREDEDIDEAVVDLF